MVYNNTTNRCRKVTATGFVSIPEHNIKYRHALHDRGSCTWFIIYIGNRYTILLLLLPYTRYTVKILEAFLYTHHTDYDMYNL